MVLFGRTEFRMLERKLRCMKFGLLQNLAFAIVFKVPCHSDKASVLSWTLLLWSTAAFVLEQSPRADWGRSLYCSASPLSRGWLWAVLGRFSRGGSSILMFSLLLSPAVKHDKTCREVLFYHVENNTSVKNSEA